jgi:hypothetical protein
LILVPLIDLKFLNELAAGDAGTSNRRHWPTAYSASIPTGYHFTEGTRVKATCRRFSPRSGHSCPECLLATRSDLQHPVNRNAS